MTAQLSIMLMACIVVISAMSPPLAARNTQDIPFPAEADDDVSVTNQDEHQNQLEHILQKRTSQQINLNGYRTTQISTRRGGVSEYAVDGNTNGNYPINSCTHTDASDHEPWWMVDIGTSTCVGEVILYNRVDCCKERLLGAVVRIGDDKVVLNNPACGGGVSRAQISAGQRITVPCNRVGRYISVHLPGNNRLLTLCEVMAYRGVCAGRDAVNPGSVGSTYIRWGRITCPDTSDLVYKGIVGGSYYAHVGGGANYLCLPDVPESLQVRVGKSALRDYLYSAEYETSDFPPLAHLHNHVVPCAMCRVNGRGTEAMFPAKTTCPPNWTSEYKGYLMSAYHNIPHQTEFICVDENAEPRPGTPTTKYGARLYPVEARCDTGGLPCLPYVNGNEVACVVCTM